MWRPAPNDRLPFLSPPPFPPFYRLLLATQHVEAGAKRQTPISLPPSPPTLLQTAASHTACGGRRQMTDSHFSPPSPSPPTLLQTAASHTACGGRRQTTDSHFSPPSPSPPTLLQTAASHTACGGRRQTTDSHFSPLPSHPFTDCC